MWIDALHPRSALRWAFLSGPFNKWETQSRGWSHKMPSSTRRMSGRARVCTRIGPGQRTAPTPSRVTCVSGCKPSTEDSMASVFALVEPVIVCSIKDASREGRYFKTLTLGESPLSDYTRHNLSKAQRSVRKPALFPPGEDWPSPLP